MTAATPRAGGNPFDPRVVLALVLFGALVFVVLLWMIGAGLTSGSTNDGTAHAGSKGLTGYAALASLAERRGHPVFRSQSLPRLRDRGLLVLTPPLLADGKAIEKVIEERRHLGSTVLVLPKWEAFPAKFIRPDAGEGWVQIVGAQAPEWVKDLGRYKIAVKGEGKENGQAIRWSGLGREGDLPDPRVQRIESDFVVPLVEDDAGHVLAAYWFDHGVYPDLAAAADVVGDEDPEADRGLYPLIIVAEPDLLDNWGMADKDRAALALDLLRLADGEERGAINFDLTFNGHKRAANLLTLAFRPPFLAATLCLLLAALAAGWRAFCRFGPPRAEERAIAFGKRALVANSAGLVRRSGRLHLLGAPYAALVRERLVRALALPRHADPAVREAAIDRALASRDAGAVRFSALAAQLRAARRPAELLRAGRALHSIERTLTR